MSDKTDEGRRGFLKLAAVAPAAAAIPATRAAADEARPEGGSGLKDTAHTRAFYDSARF